GESGKRSWVRIGGRHDVCVILSTMLKNSLGNAFSLAIEYHRETDGRWLADIPALPGVTAYGRTKKAATAAAQALALRLIADRLEQGEAVPGSFNVSFIAA